MSRKSISSIKYSCQNGAKFNISKFSSYSTFACIQHKYFFTFNFYIYAKFNTYIYIQQLYWFTKLLSIQKVFIHSTIFYSFKIYCACLLHMQGISEEAQMIIGNLERYRPHLSEPLSIDFCKYFSLIFC